jgi:hypothetical protein
MKAWLNLRYTVPARRAAFESGLRRMGYEIASGLPTSPGERDVLITWNRIGDGDRCAGLFESRGLPVLVAENAAWGNDFAGRRWYSLARNYHNTAGCFPIGGNERWDSLGVELPPWRAGGETVILPQRGIGPAYVAMPRHWPDQALRKYGGRLRRHPGKHELIPLEIDLKNCGRVITWGSGAAVKAVMLGIPVLAEMLHWIGQQDNTDAGRLDMLRRLAWAQWQLHEIESGEAFAQVLAR